MAQTERPPVKHEPILATIGEAAEMLRVSEPTIYRLMRAKRLQSVKLGCRTLFRIKTLHEFAESLQQGQGSAESVGNNVGNDTASAH